MKMKKIFVLKSINDLENFSKKFLEFYKDKKKFAFYGEMGSGKTTIIKAICRNLGVKNNMSSPTFSIINEYEIVIAREKQPVPLRREPKQSPVNSRLLRSARNDEPIYHIDFYRLKNLKEAMDVGVEEYFNNENYCFIEWPEIAKTILPENIVQVNITVKENQDRIIKIKLKN